MAGAGISTSAGIPDFRSPITGLYAKLEKFDLPYPEALFDIKYFQSNPQPFYTLYNELYPDGAKYRPTLTHCFLRLLEKKGKLLRVFTQNSMSHLLTTVDALEQLAGLAEENIVEAHGSFANARCVKCKVPVEQDWLEKKVKSGIVARCERCPSRKDLQAPPIKPDITCMYMKMITTVFGENLPERFFDRLYDFRRADLLLVMGTSLVVSLSVLMQVQPFASLIDEVPLSCPRALLNLEKVGERKQKFSFIHDDDEGFDFDDKYSRDVFCQGKVDETVRKLAKYCGWEVRLNH